MASNKTLEISEIFSSLQGESTFAGFPCAFIRVSGCNLRCSYCDSRYAFEEKGRLMTVDEILEAIALYPGFLVEITGGEPLLQQNVYELIEKLLAYGRTVLIETNGSLDIAAVPIKATVIMDIKCPGSGSSSIHPNNLETIRKRTSLRAGSVEIKFVLTGIDDYVWAKEMVLLHDLPAFASVLFSPVRHLLPAKDLAEAILKDGLPVRLQLQLHAIIWPEKSRGV